MDATRLIINCFTEIFALKFYLETASALFSKVGIMAKFLEAHLQRLQKALKEPGILNDVLKFAEDNTGIDRIYIAPGNKKTNNKIFKCLIARS